jgi:spermidine/putrescine transport system substrate-binding protein
MTLRLSRREFLRHTGIGIGALSLGSLLAACGSGGTPGSTFGSEPAGILNFANWPLYIDKARKPDGTKYSPSLEEFTRKTDVLVNYREVIPDGEWFFQRIEPRLAAGEPTGWDLMVITNGITLTKMKRQGYLVELPSNLRPNFDRYAGDFVKDPPYDPGNRFTMAWQSGITGIAYDPDLTGRPVTSLRDLFSDEFAGMVGMFGDIVDMPNIALLALGAIPETSTEEDWQGAADLLIHQRDSGVLREYYQQNYIPALANGDVAITMAWSGDIFAAKIFGKISPRIRFVVPEEGALLWTDNMCIPKGAQHLSDAITYMDYVYRPEVAAQIAQFVNYITPVPVAKADIEKMAEEAKDPAEAARLREVAESSLVFPTPDITAGLHTYRELKTEEESNLWDELFPPIYSGASAPRGA